MKPIESIRYTRMSDGTWTVALQTKEPGRWSVFIDAHREGGFYSYSDAHRYAIEQIEQRSKLIPLNAIAA